MKLHARVLRVFSLVAVVLGLAAPAANAASIFIDAANLRGPTITSPEFVAFNWGQFEGGFSVNGSTPITTGGSVFSDGVQLNFTGQWIDLGAAVGFTRTVYWVPFNDPLNYDNILQWTITPSGASGLATISGFFQSGGDGFGAPIGSLPGGVSPTDVIIETLNGSHDPFNFSAAFLGGQVITGAVEVPVPTTAFLIGMGLVGFAGVRSRRRKLIDTA